MDEYIHNRKKIRKTLFKKDNNYKNTCNFNYLDYNNYAFDGLTEEDIKRIKKNNFSQYNDYNKYKLISII